MHWLFLFSSPPPSRLTFLPQLNSTLALYSLWFNFQFVLQKRSPCGVEVLFLICTLAFCIHRNALSRTTCTSFVRVLIQTEILHEWMNEYTQAFLEFIYVIKSQQSTACTKYEACSFFRATLSRAGGGRDLSDCLENKVKQLKQHVSRLVGKASTASSLAEMAQSRPWSRRLSEVRNVFMLQRNNVSSANSAKWACSQSSAS